MSGLLGVVTTGRQRTSVVRRGEAIEDLERRFPGELAILKSVSLPHDLPGDARGEAKDAGRLALKAGEPASEDRDGASRDLLPAAVREGLNFARWLVVCGSLHAGSTDVRRCKSSPSLSSTNTQLLRSELPPISACGTGVVGC
jgi:hypothetical protein